VPRRRRLTPSVEPRGPGLGRLAALSVLLAVFFVLPAALFVRLSGTEGPGRLAAMTLALTLPATGALLLRLNPDLIPDRAALRRLAPADWASLAVLAALVLSAAGWLAAGR
jgi:hypothetical protein